jgi:YD repeat-containing protein
MLGNLTYGYDLSGKRVAISGSFARTNTPLSVGSATYNSGNQLTSWGGTPQTYDLNGNVTSDGAHTYAWDGRNHLKQLDAGTTASFSYDPFGRRVAKNISGTTTSFLYDGANPVQELAGPNVTANLLTGTLDEYFTRTDSSGARYFLTDALGSTLALADSSGALQTNYTYEPFGSTTLSGSATTNSFAYTGRETDSGNPSLYYYRARYYLDPA